MRVVGVSIFEFDRDEYEKIILAEKREEGRVEGREEGRAEGRAEWAYDKAVCTARNLLTMGLLSLEQIAQATQLPLSEIAAL